MIRVLLAEDQAMVRGALAALLSREQDIEVVAEVARGDEVVQAALASQPDVALLDIEMPGGDGLAAAQTLQKALPTCRSAGVEKGAADLPQRDPDHLWTQRLLAPGHRERSGRVSAQGRPGSRTRCRFAPRDGRRAGG